MLGALVLFVLGSALCGSAQSMTWLIAARGEFSSPPSRCMRNTFRYAKLRDTNTVIQGLGAGGLQSIPNIIVGDLVPLSERGTFQGMIGL